MALKVTLNVLFLKNATEKPASLRAHYFCYSARHTIFGTIECQMQLIYAPIKSNGFRLIFTIFLSLRIDQTDDWCVCVYAIRNRCDIVACAFMHVDVCAFCNFWTLPILSFRTASKCLNNTFTIRRHIEHDIPIAKKKEIIILYYFSSFVRSFRTLDDDDK